MEKKIVAALTHTKGLVILGFVFIGAAVVMRLQTPAARPIVRTPEPTPSPVEALNMLAKATQVSTKPKLDINGTYECKYASISAQLSKKQLYAVNSSGPQPTYTLFKEDCLYSWKKNARTGVTKCGLGQYVSMYEMMSSMGMGDAGDMISTVLAHNLWLPHVSRRGL
ncbi:hypothetical protein HYS00_05455 [Candidatus Microgenomates bacterium]|nr:hypothetical protein [Candidatus Microgenomates bacterium]